jgi:CRISPR-associated protein Csy1
MDDSDKEKSTSLKSFIHDFIRQRAKPKLEEQEKKLDKAESQEEKEKILQKISEIDEKYQPENWLADAAKRTGQISMATHIPKYTHPMAKASSVYYAPEKDIAKNAGTHSVKKPKDDVFGNAAALDVFGFLQQGYNGVTILNMAESNPDLLINAMSENREAAQGWLCDFLSIKNLRSPESHTLMKQLYSPLEGGGYHIIAPLFPTTFVQEVYERIVDSRFGEGTKSARDARKKNLQHNGYREFYGTAVTTYGGTKPQNISQQNSVRHGENILLSSCPPVWKAKEIKPVNASSAFPAFSSRAFVKELLLSLRKLLSLDYNNAYIRQGRLNIVKALADELYSLYAEKKKLPSGWSRKPECRLVQHQKLWLDYDPENAGYQSGEWCDAVADEFGLWLNARIRKMDNGRFQVGDAEFREWKKSAAYVLDDIRRENIHG